VVLIKKSEEINTWTSGDHDGAKIDPDKEHSFEPSTFTLIQSSSIMPSLRLNIAETWPKLALLFLQLNTICGTNYPKSKRQTSNQLVQPCGW
jgi:hypothetical protein